MLGPFFFLLFLKIYHVCVFVLLHSSKFHIYSTLKVIVIVWSDKEPNKSVLWYLFQIPVYSFLICLNSLFIQLCCQKLWYQMAGWLCVMNLQGCGRKWLWPNRRFYPRREENHKSLFRVVRAPSDIQTRHLPHSSYK